MFSRCVYSQATFQSNGPVRFYSAAWRWLKILWSSSTPGQCWCNQCHSNERRGSVCGGENGETIKTAHMQCQWKVIPFNSVNDDSVQFRQRRFRSIPSTTTIPFDSVNDRVITFSFKIKTSKKKQPNSFTIILSDLLPPLPSSYLFFVFWFLLCQWHLLLCNLTGLHTIYFPLVLKNVDLSCTWYCQ